MVDTVEFEALVTWLITTVVMLANDCKISVMGVRRDDRS